MKGILLMFLHDYAIVLRSSLVASLLMIFSLLIISCSDNQVMIDVSSGEIITCNGSEIKTVLISGPGFEDFYVIKKKYGGKGDGRLDIFNIGENYIVLENKKLIIKPNSTYKIIHISNGDAAPCEIEFNTDSNSRIVHSNNMTCY